jgi:hypothetical protein
VLPEEQPLRCPACNSLIAEVGTRSDLHEWAQTRRQGRVRFVLARVLFGVLIAVVQCALAWWHRGEVATFASAATWPLLGLALGLLYWRRAERDYAAWVARQRNSGPRAVLDQTSK